MTNRELANNIFYGFILMVISGVITLQATGDAWDKDIVTKKSHLEQKCKFYFEPDCKDLKGGK